MISVKFGGWTWKSIHSYKLLWDEHMFGKVLTHSHTIGIYWDIGNWQETVCHGLVQEWGCPILMGKWNHFLAGWLIKRGPSTQKTSDHWCTVYLCGNDVCSGFHMMIWWRIPSYSTKCWVECVTVSTINETIESTWQLGHIRPFGPYIPKLQSAGSPAGEGSLPSCPQRSWHRHYFRARVHRAQGLNTWMEHFRILAAVGCVDRAWLLKIGIRISLKGPRFLQPICNLPFVQDVRVSFVHVGKFLTCAHSSSACFRHA